MRKQAWQRTFGRRGLPSAMSVQREQESRQSLQSCRNVLATWGSSRASTFWGPTIPGTSANLSSMLTIPPVHPRAATPTHCSQGKRRLAYSAGQIHSLDLESHAFLHLLRVNLVNLRVHCVMTHLDRCIQTLILHLARVGFVIRNRLFGCSACSRSTRGRALPPHTPLPPSPAPSPQRAPATD